MRIGIDARLYAYRTGGISFYTRHLLAAMATLAPDETFVTLQHHSQRQPLIAAANVRRAAMFTPPHNRFEPLALPVEMARLRLAMAHFPDFIAPRLRPCPAVITIHDLTFLHYPEILDDAARHFYGQVHASVRHADAVIAVSAATRDDICQMLDVPAERIDLVYEAAAPGFVPLEMQAGARRRINGHELRAGDFALFVSTLEPRKNIPTLLRALRLCLDRSPATAYRLVLAGARGWRDEPIFTAVDELKLGAHVLFLGKVAQEDLHWLYNACRLYVNPSLYEGFGLPLLEALACGAPVVASHTGSLVEVAGEAAILLPPLEIEAWAETLARLWQDKPLRAEMAQRGPVQAARFSWERAAHETLAIYRRVVGRAA